VVRRARLRSRQPAQPQRHRRAERPLRHHRQRARLQRHAPGAARPRPRRRVCRRIGLRLHKVNVVWPLEATITRDFAEGLQEILVVEEKRQVIEYQLKEELYGWRPDVRPHVLGKFDESERRHTGGEWSQANPSQHWLLRAQADLTPAIIAKAIAKRLGKLGVDGDVWPAWRCGSRSSTPRRRASPRDARRDRRRRRPASARRGSAAAARTTRRPRCPKARAPSPASAATTWRSGWTARR
jgi:TPP-dependent indolepyruvate ferredoxin oxidoreductase alpha subunit